MPETTNIINERSHKIRDQKLESAVYFIEHFSYMIDKKAKNLNGANIHSEKKNANHKNLEYIPYSKKLSDLKEIFIEGDLDLVVLYGSISMILNYFESAHFKIELVHGKLWEFFKATILIYQKIFDDKCWMLKDFSYLSSTPKEVLQELELTLSLEYKKININPSMKDIKEAKKYLDGISELL